MKRVCVHWPRLGPYHLPRLLAAHARFARRGVELVALETAPEDDYYAWRAEGGETPFRRVQVFPGRNFNAIRPAEMEAGVLRALDALRPDAVAIHSYSFPDARACLAWCRRRRRTAVLMLDSRLEDGPRVAWRERFKRRMLGQFDAALVAGTATRAYLEALGFPAGLIFDGYDVVDNAYFADGAEAARRAPEASAHLPGLADPTPYFVCVSRYLALKNLDGLLRAYAAYRRAAARPWRLVLVGDGPERASLEAFVAREGLAGVTLTGFRQIEDLPAYYGRAAALVHPAFKDTWGLVVNEAMAAGLPVVVSTGAGCVPDLVDEGRSGYAFDPRDEARLETLLHRMSSPDADAGAMGTRGRALIAAWSPERFAASLERAVDAGAPRSDRGFDPLTRGVFLGLRYSARSVEAFHSIEA